MGACCCKDTESEHGERDRLLVNPVSDDDDMHYPRSSYGTRDQNGGQSSGQTDLNAAVTQILESVAVQVIDVAGAHTAAPALEQQEYLQRSRAFLKAGNEELRGLQQPRRPLPTATASAVAAAAGNGGPAAALANGASNQADLQLVAGAAQAVAHAVASLSVRPPEDLLVQFGVPT